MSALPGEILVPALVAAIVFAALLVRAMGRRRKRCRRLRLAGRIEEQERRVRLLDLYRQMGRTVVIRRDGKPDLIFEAVLLGDHVVQHGKRSRTEYRLYVTPDGTYIPVVHHISPGQRHILARLAGTTIFGLAGIATTAHPAVATGFLALALGSAQTRGSKGAPEPRVGAADSLADLRRWLYRTLPGEQREAGKALIRSSMGLAPELELLLYERLSP